jgi:hypothetical protein
MPAVARERWILMANGACGDVGKACVDGSGFVDGSNGRFGEFAREEYARQTGFSYDTFLIVFSCSGKFTTPR